MNLQYISIQYRYTTVRKMEFAHTGNLTEILRC